MQAPPKQLHHGPQAKNKEKGKMMMTQASGRRADAEKTTGSCQNRRERKIALKQDVDKLQKKLRHEENIHRALERAFTRPLGALPRLPPYLPSNTLVLLAEVAILEEEVVRLEEQVVNFSRGLYKEALYSSSLKKLTENKPDLYPAQNVSKHEQNKSSLWSAKSDPTIGSESSSASSNSHSDKDQNGHSAARCVNMKRILKKQNTSSMNSDDPHGKENCISNSPVKNRKESSKKVPPSRPNAPSEKHASAR